MKSKNKRGVSQTLRGSESALCKEFQLDQEGLLNSCKRTSGIIQKSKYPEAGVFANTLQSVLPKLVQFLSKGTKKAFIETLRVFDSLLYYSMNHQDFKVSLVKTLMRKILKTLSPHYAVVTLNVFDSENCNPKETPGPVLVGYVTSKSLKNTKILGIRIQNKEGLQDGKPFEYIFRRDETKLHFSYYLSLSNPAKKE